MRGQRAGGVSVRLAIRGRLSALGQQWRDAIEPMVLRHPNRASVILLTLTGGDEMNYAVDCAEDSTQPGKPMRSPFNIATINLTYFPGVRLARLFVCAAHCGYLAHEALELVTVGDLTTRALDPHGPDEATSSWNRPVRDGMPSHLTPTTLERALCVVMSSEDARQAVGAP